MNHALIGDGVGDDHEDQSEIGDETIEIHAGSGTTLNKKKKKNMDQSKCETKTHENYYG